MNGLTVSDINMSTVEGQALFQSIILLSTTTHTNKTPDEILYQLQQMHHKQFEIGE